MGFQRFYGIDWRQQRQTRWWVDLMILVEKLDDFEWTKTDENIAHLVDREDFWLNAEYSSWITDADDPEIQSAREHRKQSGMKPPPKPILWPIAERPQRAAAKLSVRVLGQYQEHEQAQKKRQKRKSLKAFRAALGR
ncbi:hypothetical protein [Corynebacterium silvaticum]|nr:hypothetical protein [Corynebacterium silvaticum]